jgi:hypothetical protein
MSTAQEITHKATASMVDRIDTATADVKFGDWSDPQRGMDYVAVLRGLAFWVQDDHTVVGTAPDTSDGLIWGYAASDVLDGAASEFDLPDSARIDQVGPLTYTLTW